MKYTSIVSMVLLTVLVAVSLSAAGGAAPSETASQDLLTQGNRAFSVQLYRQLATGEDNLFFSPHSISAAMAMTYAGARGKTAEEMKRALHFDLDQDQLHPAFKLLNTGLVNGSDLAGQKLNVANALVLTGDDVSQAYKTLLKDYYDAEIFPGDLETINAWVRNKTEHKIEKILDELSRDSVCVILNAIYFKGLWAFPFDQDRTADAPFNVSHDRQVTVPLMQRNADLRLLKENGFRALSLPYQGERLSMVILLPNQVDGLNSLEEQATEPNLKQWLAALDSRQPRKVRLYLPRFNLETSYDLVPPFQRMGIAEAFQMPVADFRGMGWPKGKLRIAQIKHKAFVEVNEEGTEAAAVTAVEMVTKSIMEHPEEFRVDHPFLFLIRDHASGTILFMGRMVDPGR
ncbi:serpin family protein [Desulfatitalea tepidiphila]|uniref:serpin family protein n=1 Tax=Desulfatitalea tepidiphila TaxID=1185843 RepID=UPI0006B455B5|nr:serpin family protein [Desulfatitalea tepidiphila]